MAEEWRPVVGYEGSYEVSNHGRIRGVDRTVTHRNGRMTRVAGIDLRCSPDGYGYPRVELYKEGRSRTFGVHQIVAAAFIGPCPDGLEIRHLDGVKTNNTVENLKYGTHSENAYDMWRHGVTPRRVGVRGGHTDGLKVLADRAAEMRSLQEELDEAYLEQDALIVEARREGIPWSDITTADGRSRQMLNRVYRAATE